MSRPIARRVATAVSGALLLGAAAGVVVAGEQWPPPEQPLEAVDVSVAASTLTQVCPGPPRLATSAAGQDLGYDEFDPEGSGTQSLLTALNVPRNDAPPEALVVQPDLGAEATEEAPRTGEVRLVELPDIGQPAAVHAEPVADQPALAAGTSIALTEEGDLRGLTATACQTPASSHWLVGGSTQPGDSAQLVLANPGDTAASVTLRGWGSTGPLDLAGAGTVLVPPHGEQVVLVESLATDPRIALQLESAGGTVTATLQDSRLRGLVPAGTDFVTAGAAPSEELIIPGVVLGEASGQDEDAPQVRIVNPGEELVTATLELLGADGPISVPGAADMAIDAGAVVDVSLAGLPAGTWTARVQADGPVAGAAAVTLAGEPDEGDSPPIDRTWLPATTGLSTGLSALPQVGAAELVLANPADREVTVAVVPVLADGTRAEPVERTLPPGTTAALSTGELADQELVGLEVQTEGTVHAAVVLTVEAPDGTLISGLAVAEDARTAQAVPLVPTSRTLR